MGAPRQEILASTASGESSGELLAKYKSDEKFIAVVGPAGAGSGTAAKILASILTNEGYKTEIIKVSSLISEFAEKKGKAVPTVSEHKNIDDVIKMQDLGDSIRKGEEYGLKEDHAAVARLIIKKIKELRESDKPDIQSSEQEDKRAFIIDSLRHPAEAILLREVYKELFSLIGVVCNPDIRVKRIEEKLISPGSVNRNKIIEKIEEYIARDEDAKDDHGQKVARLFYEADFFVDNTIDATDRSITQTSMNEPLQRFAEIITHKKIVRPNTHEAAMYQAHAAQLQSACLSRQVGAALVDKNYNIVATGLNDVPKAGGGLYGQGFETKAQDDHRCAYRGAAFCSSNKEQNEIIDELIAEFPSLVPEEKDREEVVGKIRKTRIGGLIEFSRAVHAEMNAIISAAVSGISPKGCRLYVSTYPCHYCARHIVTAGIDEVQFIEPYPKSKATELHDDSITTEVNEDWKAPSDGGTKVLFRPFVGVAPRFYKLAFLKDRDYKDKKTGDIKIGFAQPGVTNTVYTESYNDLEDTLTEDFRDE